MLKMSFPQNNALKVFLVIGFALPFYFSSLSHAKIIQAEIEHKEFLPEVPTDFRRGAVIKEASVRSRVEWFPVPDWMAGTWMKEGDIETFEKDFQRNQSARLNKWMPNRVSINFGHLKDARNTIWHAEVTPFRADGKRGMTKDQRYVVSMSCLNSTPNKVVLRFHSVVVTQSRGVVTRSRQQEEIIKFYPSNKSFITSESSTKTFDERGRPLYQLNSHTKRLKVKGFVERRRLSGIDLVVALRNFLLKNNMQDRVTSP